MTRWTSMEVYLLPGNRVTRSVAATLTSLLLFFFQDLRLLCCLGSTHRSAYRGTTLRRLLRCRRRCRSRRRRLRCRRRCRSRTILWTVFVVLLTTQWTKMSQDLQGTILNRQRHPPMDWILLRARATAQPLHATVLRVRAIALRVRATVL